MVVKKGVRFGRTDNRYWIVVDVIDRKDNILFVIALNESFEGAYFFLDEQGNDIRIVKKLDSLWQALVTFQQLTK